MKTGLAAAYAIAATLPAIATPACAHRLDEYLQAATISIEKDRVQAQMRLTPGVAVFPGVFAAMDTNGDGILSEAERRAYAQRVLGDLSLRVDGNSLRLHLLTWKFARPQEMKEGRGDVQLEFEADVPRRNRSQSLDRRLVFENHHQGRIAVYLVNCLVPRDPDIQVTAQKRNYQQSRYELDYTQNGVPSALTPAARQWNVWEWAGMTALLAFAPLAFAWRRIRAKKDAEAEDNGASGRETASSQDANEVPQRTTAAKAGNA